MKLLACYTTIIFLLPLVKCQGSNFTTSAPFTAQKLDLIVAGARGMIRDPSGDFLIASRSQSNVFVVFQETLGGMRSVQLTNVTELLLSHAVAFSEGFIYASSQNVVYRWPYVPGSRVPIQAEPQVVINNIPSSNGGSFHSRPITFDSYYIYVGVGAKGNVPVDPDSNQTRIRRFTLDSEETWPLDYETGEVFADGVRNDVGIAFDLNGTLWGVENGVTGSLSRPDLGPGDYTLYNPAEKLNRFGWQIGRHYGYPYCFASYNLENYPSGTMLAWGTFLDSGEITDEWCQDVLNVEPPALAMPAHAAPMGIHFYDGSGCGSTQGSFPCDMTGDAFVTFHGSTCCGGAPPVGYGVVRLPFNKTTNLPTGEILDVVFDVDKNRCVDGTSRATCFRPVSVAFTTSGHLVVNLDNTGELILVQHEGTSSV